MPDAEPAPVPPGTYAGQGRSPIVWAYLCPPCGGYAPITDEGYAGALSGRCKGCGSYCRELHRFPSLIDSAAGCGCRMAHQRVTGDLAAAGSAAELVRWMRAEAGRMEELAHRPELDARPERAMQREHQLRLSQHLIAAIACIAVMRPELTARTAPKEAD